MTRLRMMILGICKSGLCGVQGEESETKMIWTWKKEMCRFTSVEVHEVDYRGYEERQR